LTQGKPVKYDGDPLQDFTTQRFLDRFVYRNPKKDKKTASTTQNGLDDPIDEQAPVRLTKNKRIVNRKKAYNPWGVKSLVTQGLSIKCHFSLPVTGREYINKPEAAIPVDERFVHRFMSTVGESKAQERDFDAASVNSEEFDAIVGWILRIILIQCPEQFEPGRANDAFDLDFEKGVVAKKAKGKKRHKQEEESDEQSSDEDFEDDEIEPEEPVRLRTPNLIFFKENVKFASEEKATKSNYAEDYKKKSSKKKPIFAKKGGKKRRA